MADLTTTAALPGANQDLAQLQSAAQAASLAQAGRSLKSQPSNSAAIDKTARQFEAMVLGQMVGYMFAGVETDPLLGGGYGEDMYRGLLITEYGKVMAESGGVGIADSVKAQLIQMQEAKGQ